MKLWMLVILINGHQEVVSGDYPSKAECLRVAGYILSQERLGPLKCVPARKNVKHYEYFVGD
jgi:hypothetical protein